MKHGVIPIAKKQDSWLAPYLNDSPSPQAYNTSAGFVPKKVSIGHKFKEQYNLTPGPGAFNLEPHLKFASSQTFGSAPRDNLLVPKEKQFVPGPADYSPSRTKFDSKVVDFIVKSRSTITKSSTTPKLGCVPKIGFKH